MSDSHSRKPFPGTKSGHMTKHSPDAYILTLGNQTGGVETWIRDFLHFTTGNYELLPRLASARRVFAVGGSEEKNSNSLPAGAKRPVAFFPLVRELVVVRKSTTPLHAHNLKLALLALILARPCPLVYFSHNNFGRQLSYQNIFKRRLYFALERMVLKKAATVFTFSREDQQRMRHHRQEVGLLEGSYNDLLFPANPTDDSATRSGLLWVGRLSPVKNPLLALRSFELLAQHYPGTLTFVGDGPLRRVLEKSVRNSPVGERVSITGSLSPAEIRQRLHCSEALLVTSLSEGPTPRNIYEALACGTPVVATRPGDPDMLIEKAGAGVLTESPDPESFFEAIKSCLVITKRTYDKAIFSNKASVFFPAIEKPLHRQNPQAS